MLVLLAQPWIGASHAASMAMGTEICTSSGIQLIDAHGKAMEASQHDSHDCCCTGAVGLPGNIALGAPDPCPQAGPAELLSARRLDAAWLAPLSRGPPAAL